MLERGRMDPPRIGDELAGYRLERLIGTGGSSQVYLAVQLRLQREVALKILLPHLGDDLEFRARFIREARIAARLDHPNVVTVYDAGATGGLLFLAMRYIAGRDLGHELQGGSSLGVERTLSIVEQVAAALDAAHAEGLIHRDVKPGNVLLTTEERGTEHAYLSDFGITRSTRSEIALTREGRFVGTIDYAAPEQIRGEEVDARTDVYSLGCLLVRCLSGSVPFSRDTDAARLYAHLDDPPPSLAAIGLAPFDVVIGKALAKAPADRFESCTALGEAARDAASDPAAIASRMTQPAITRGGRHAAPTAKRSRNGRWWATRAVAASVALLLVGLGIATWPWTSEPDGVAASRFVWDDPILPRAPSGGGAIVDVVANPPGDLAVGYVDDGSGEHAAAWRSADGETWEPLPDSAFPHDSRLLAVAQRQGTIVVGGFVKGTEGQDAAVWVWRDDADTWKRAQLHWCCGAGDQEIRSITTFGEGFAAVGYRTDEFGKDPAVWVSDLGFKWKPDSVGGLVKPGDQEMVSVAPWIGTQLIAVGDTNEDGKHAAVWFRNGKGDWQTGSDDLTLSGIQQMYAVASTRDLIVAVGTDGDPGRPHAAVWTSLNGVQWTRDTDPVDAEPAGSISSMYDIAVFGDLWVASGWIRNSSGDEDAAIWVSSDGLAWQREGGEGAEALAGPGRQEALVLARDPTGAHLMALGLSEASDRIEPAVWVGSSSTT